MRGIPRDIFNEGEGQRKKGIRYSGRKRYTIEDDDPRLFDERSFDRCAPRFFPQKRQIFSGGPPHRCGRRSLLRKNEEYERTNWSPSFKFSQKVITPRGRVIFKSRPGPFFNGADPSQPSQVKATSCLPRPEKTSLVVPCQCPQPGGQASNLASTPSLASKRRGLQTDRYRL